MLEDKIVEIITKLQAQLTAFAPQAWNAILWVTRINGLSNFIGGWVLLWLTLKLLKLTRKLAAEDDYDNQPLVVFSAIGTVIAGIATVLLLLDPWTYVAMFAPQLEVAHQIIKHLVK